MAPRARYARGGEISIAYAVMGDGPIGLVFADRGEHELEGVPDRGQVYAASSAS